jgi:hypothetical protein
MRFSRTRLTDVLHRRCSAGARQGRFGLGAMTVPLRVEQPVNPVLLDLGDGELVDARRAAVAAHLLPRPLQDVPAGELVGQ